MDKQNKKDKNDKDKSNNWYWKSLKSLKIKIKQLKESFMLPKNYKVQNKMFQLFYELEKRRNELGLYEFKNGSARIDITGHVCNGCNKLQTN